MSSSNHLRRACVVVVSVTRLDILCLLSVVSVKGQHYPRWPTSTRLLCNRLSAFSRGQHTPDTDDDVRSTVDQAHALFLFRDTSGIFSARSLFFVVRNRRMSARVHETARHRTTVLTSERDAHYRSARCELERNISTIKIKIRICGTLPRT